MSTVVGHAGIEVKAAGGIINSYNDVQKMIKAGATRLGTSTGNKIIPQAKPNNSLKLIQYTLITRFRDQFKWLGN
jgi:deoxyribose-phosphate aldolase